MMYITYTETINGVEEEVDVHWHIGEQLPNHLKNYCNNVVRIQADGDELAFIQGYFKNLPWSYNTSVLRWYGDHAKFIVANFLGW